MQVINYIELIIIIRYVLKGV